MIVALYEGSAPDDRGRSLETILQFDDEQLEEFHDFIQWLFPLAQWLFPLAERSSAQMTSAARLRSEDDTKMIATSVRP